MKFKINDKVKCIKFISLAIQMDKVYTVIGINHSFDNKQFLRFEETEKQHISYDAEHFKKC